MYITKSFSLLLQYVCYKFNLQYAYIYIIILFKYLCIIAVSIKSFFHDLGSYILLYTSIYLFILLIKCKVYNIIYNINMSMYTYIHIYTIYLMIAIVAELWQWKQLKSCANDFVIVTTLQLFLSPTILYAKSSQPVSMSFVKIIIRYHR